MRKQRAFLLLSTLLACAISFASAAGETCSATQKCPKDSPCCGVGGTCGSGSYQCAGGCQPMMSFAPSSCLPNPICQDKNITFAPTDYNNAHQFWPILLYNGDSSNAPFTLDYGFLGKGQEGVLLELTEQSQTKISTTDYMLYGNIQLSARHNALAGLVFAFITMSDTKDEIDWEFTTAQADDAQTNYFSQGVIAKGTAQSIKTPSSFSVSDWHTYGLNWQQNQLQWTIDGKVVRTVTRNQAGTNYPRSPSRIQVSVWAGGNSTNPPGVIDWSGGAIDWTSNAYTSSGYYSAEIRSFQTTCASQSSLNLTKVGSGNTTTSWVYTGQMNDNEPQFALSTDPISFLSSPGDDAHPGLPGYPVQSDFSKSNSNAWDGSGNTSGLSKKEVTGKSNSNSSSSNSGGWLANNRTLSIAVPAIAAAAALGAIWALCVCLYRRRKRKEAHNNPLGSGVLAKSGVPLTNGSVGFNNVNSSNKGTRYQALYDDEDEASESEARYADPTPMGAQKVGKGYGPASGPRPGPMNRQEWSDSSSSLNGADEYAMSEHKLGYAQPQQRFQQQTPQFQPQRQQPQQMQQRQQPQQMPQRQLPQPQNPQYEQRRYPASPAVTQFGTPGTPYPNGGVRGPYTPGMNAYTPALHQTPAALQASFAPSQVSYNAPQRMNGYDQQYQQSYQQQQQQQQQYPRYR